MRRDLTRKHKETQREPAQTEAFLREPAEGTAAVKEERIQPLDELVKFQALLEEDKQIRRERKKKSIQEKKYCEDLYILSVTYVARGWSVEETKVDARLYVKRAKA